MRHVGRRNSQKAVFENKKNDSALAEYADTCQGSIQWDDTSILAFEHQFLMRSIRESLEISSNKIKNEAIKSDDVHASKGKDPKQIILQKKIANLTSQTRKMKLWYWTFAIC